MGLTYDYGDAARNRRSANGSSTHDSDGPRGQSHDDAGQGIGIPRILRRRARWVSARLRHTLH
ncbi:MULTISPECIES: hypothetical protein [Streptomyces]|uniref:Uncharacterized protein n=1 Tax=Streptomyces amakusaensis TaxID=67271 RepID=A0ABW0ARY9_9ACTN|nr:hypothetical protein [Streptomyces inusitatus]